MHAKSVDFVFGGVGSIIFHGVRQLRSLFEHRQHLDDSTSLDSRAGNSFLDRRG